MRKILYKAINKLGYRIYNKKNEKDEISKRLSKFNVSIYYSLLFKSAQYVFDLNEKFQDLEISDSKNGLKVSFQKLVFCVESREEFFILKEIFIENEYNFIMNEDCVLIDVGANVGMASISFSQLDFIKKIYAFEPVKDSFEIAQNNFRMNKISKVEKFYNFGLGNEERDEEFLFNRKVKGNSGIRGKLSPSYKNKTISENREVKIKNAAQVLQPILAESKNCKIVMKMDCEGAEYEIFEILNDANVLCKIDIIMLEWHDHGASIIEKYLKDNNFIIFSRNLGPISGMIYAVR